MVDPSQLPGYYLHLRDNTPGLFQPIILKMGGPLRSQPRNPLSKTFEEEHQASRQDAGEKNGSQV
jgi:hypothetical protein